MWGGFRKKISSRSLDNCSGDWKLAHLGKGCSSNVGEDVLQFGRKEFGEKATMKGFAQRGNSKLGDDCRKLNFERVQKGKPLCVLGRDLTMDMVLALVQRSLMGNFEFINL